MSFTLSRHLRATAALGRPFHSLLVSDVLMLSLKPQSLGYLLVPGYRAFRDREHPDLFK